jgi:hypothetical protein
MTWYWIKIAASEYQRTGIRRQKALGLTRLSCIYRMTAAGRDGRIFHFIIIINHKLAHVEKAAVCANLLEGRPVPCILSRRQCSVCHFETRIFVLLK